MREKILGNNFDPTEFVMFLNSKLPIGDDIDLCTMEELEAIVAQFTAIKEQEANNFEPLGEMMGSAIEIPNQDSKSMVHKPKQILFVCCALFRPNTTQMCWKTSSAKRSSAKKLLTSTTTLNP